MCLPFSSSETFLEKERFVFDDPLPPPLFHVFLPRRLVCAGVFARGLDFLYAMHKTCRKGWTERSTGEVMKGVPF